MTPSQLKSASLYHAEAVFPDIVNDLARQPWPQVRQYLADSFLTGANFALSHQWIPVADRLPEEYRTVLAYIDSEDLRELKIALAHYDGEDFYDTHDHKIRPSHWMYIPELNPEKEER